MKTIDELSKEYLSGFKIEYNPAGMSYYVSKEGYCSVITSEVIITHGTEYRDYEHVMECAYHEDSLTDYSWQLPDPPYCDCPYTIKTYDHEALFRYIREDAKNKLS